jgi:hypothetical protein
MRLPMSSALVAALVLSGCQVDALVRNVSSQVQNVPPNLRETVRTAASTPQQPVATTATPTPTPTPPPVAKLAARGSIAGRFAKCEDFSDEYSAMQGRLSDASGLFSGYSLSKSEYYTKRAHLADGYDDFKKTLVAWLDQCRRDQSSFYPEKDSLDFTLRFRENVTARLPELEKAMNGHIDKISEEMRSDPKAASEQFAAMRAWLAAIDTVLPGNGGLRAVRADIERMDGKAKAAVAKEAASAPNPGRGGTIVFSGRPILPGHEADLGTQFKAGDTIYALAYLQKPLGQLGQVHSFYVHLDDSTWVVDDETTGDRANPLLDFEDLPKNTVAIPLEIVPDPRTATKWGAVECARHLEEASPRHHTFGISITADGSGEIAKGSIELDLSGKNDGDYLTIKQGIQATLRRTIKLPEALHPRHDAALESSFRNAYERGVPYSKVLRVILTQEEWEIRRNDLTGRILERLLGSYVVYTVRQSGKPPYCGYQFIVISEPYEGGRYGTATVDHADEQITLDCEHMPK